MRAVRRARRHDAHVAVPSSSALKGPRTDAVPEVMALTRSILRLSVLLPLLAGCGDGRGDRGPFPEGDGGAGGDAGGWVRPGEAQLGNPCEGACGSADERKCAINSDGCDNDLCLVDPSHPQITYCTVDCTSVPCPSGWRCEAIVSFGDRAVERACVAEPASCGDGAVQLGEVCDGDSPELGRCVDCARYEAVCGDGHVQDREACDGDTPDGYCVGCASILAPHFDFTVYTASAGAVFEVDGPTTHYYGASIHGFSTVTELSGDLPHAAEPDGCGSIEVVSTDAEKTVLRWIICDSDGQDRVTWTFPIPRAEVDVDVWSGTPPETWRTTALLERPAAGRSLEWTTTEHNDIFEVRVWQAGEHGLVRGDIRARLVQDDPIQSFSRVDAELQLDFAVHHPVLGMAE